MKNAYRYFPGYSGFDSRAHVSRDIDIMMDMIEAVNKGDIEDFKKNLDQMLSYYWKNSEYLWLMIIPVVSVIIKTDRLEFWREILKKDISNYFFLLKSMEYKVINCIINDTATQSLDTIVADIIKKINTEDGFGEHDARAGYEYYIDILDAAAQHKKYNLICGALEEMPFYVLCKLINEERFELLDIITDKSKNLSLLTSHTLRWTGDADEINDWKGVDYYFGVLGKRYMGEDTENAGQKFFKRCMKNDENIRNFAKKLMETALCNFRYYENLYEKSMEFLLEFKPRVNNISDMIYWIESASAKCCSMIARLLDDKVYIDAEGRYSIPCASIRKLKKYYKGEIVCYVGENRLRNEQKLSSLVTIVRKTDKITGGKINE